MPDETRRFAILEHHHRGVHWDFLIEDGDALRTWAIDAPIVPGVDLPARELPPHRRVYLDYEGSISGDRGTVRRWDRGECVVLAWGEAHVAVTLRGDQLWGEAVLRRTEDPPSRGWLFRLGKVS